MTPWFRPGGGTENALNEVLQAVTETREKYVLEIFLDIATHLIIHGGKGCSAAAGLWHSM